ncbi:MAG TPA: WD40 repeat domain-containing protein [Methylomirabilota bacterium]|nr:WD40 repeat domain-containing protein [Methylomirabilota bacterium]
MRHLPLDGTPPEVLGRWGSPDLTAFDVDPSGTWLLSAQGGRVVRQRLDDLESPARLVGTHEGQTDVCARLSRDRAATGDSSGQVRVWDVSEARLDRTLQSPADARMMALDPSGRFLAAGTPGTGGERSLVLFDLAAPGSAEPVPLLAGDWSWLSHMGFSPDGSWLATDHGGTGTVALWNVSGPRSTVLARQKPRFVSVAFTPAGDLLSTSVEGTLRRWPLSAERGAGEVLWSRPGALIGVWDVDPAGRFALVSERLAGRVLVVPLDGTAARSHAATRAPGTQLWCNARLSPDGTLAALDIISIGYPEANGLRILELQTGAERILDTRPVGTVRCEETGSATEGYALPLWLPDGRLVSDGDAGLRLWDLDTGTSHVLRACRKARDSGFFLLATPDSRTILRLEPAMATGETSSLEAFDIASGETRKITSHGNRLSSFARDPRGTALVTGSQDGVVRVGPLDGGEPHLLFGHTGPVWAAVSPDGSTVAAIAEDGTLRLWPMPDLSKRPLHTLPHDELLAKLKSLTNLRAVRDPESDTGWKIEIGPFPGWAVVPEWQP